MTVPGWRDGATVGFHRWRIVDTNGALVAYAYGLDGLASGLVFLSLYGGWVCFG